MSIIECFLCALALSVDAFVCSIIYGKKPYSVQGRALTALAIGLTFGLFQFFMPVIGLIAGSKVKTLIEEYDHWVAFILLFAVSVNMFKEAFEKCSKPHCRKLNFTVLLALGVATSIDALALGFSAGLVSVNIYLLASIIGLVCFTVSVIGFMVGQVLSKINRLDRILNIAGALVLLGIALAILKEHQVF